jgi:hypothetical protein
MGANMNQPDLKPRNLSAAVRIRLNDIEAWLDAGISRPEIADTLKSEYGFDVTIRALDQALYRARKRKDSGLHNPKNIGLHNPETDKLPAQGAGNLAATTPAASSEKGDTRPKTLEDEGRTHFTQSDFSKIDEEAQKEMESVRQSQARKKGF